MLGVMMRFFDIMYLNIFNGEVYFVIVGCRVMLKFFIYDIIFLCDISLGNDICFFILREMVFFFKDVSMLLLFI